MSVQRRRGKLLRVVLITALCFSSSITRGQGASPPMERAEATVDWAAALHALRVYLAYETLVALLDEPALNESKARERLRDRSRSRDDSAWANIK